MKNIFLRLGLLSLVFIVSVNNVAAQSKEADKNAADILRGMITAVGNLSAVEYEVEVNEERPLFSYKMKKVLANTKIIAANSPLRAVAKLQGAGDATYEMFALNGDIMQYSAAGKIGDNDLSKSFTPLTAYLDLSATWRLLLDREFFAKIVGEGRIIYGGQQIVGDDLCDVVIHVLSNSQRETITTNYYWISTTTKLPRARQTLTMNKRGKSLLPQLIITITKQNPAITPATFAYKPTEKDSVAPPESKEDKKTGSGDRELTELNGKPLPIANCSVLQRERKTANTKFLIVANNQSKPEADWITNHYQGALARA